LQNVYTRDDINDEVLDLLKSLLKYDPEERLDPMTALLHPFFDDL